MEDYKYYFEMNLEKTDFSKLGSSVRKAIEESKELDDDVKKVLLNYPVVYVHSWKNESNETLLYIGETIDIVRRTDEHEKKGESTDNSWQKMWEKGICHKSWFFSSPDMNKSLALDIEDHLMKCFDCVNKKENPQTDYSNKEKCDGLLKMIISKLDKELKLKQSLSFEPSIYEFGDDLAVYYKGFQMNEDIEGISLYSDVNDFPFGQYPIVYFHLWEDVKGKLRSYSGESNDLKRRTDQHEEFFDITDLNDVNWHSSWQNAKKRLCLFSAIGK